MSFSSWRYHEGQKGKKRIRKGYRPLSVAGKNLALPRRYEHGAGGEVSTQIVAGRPELQKHFGNTILICNWRSNRGMRFAAAIPKKEYVTVNVIGKRDVEKTDLAEFLELPEVKKRFPQDMKPLDYACQCSPKIARTASKRPFGNRMVIIGDACCSRYYKNGIESALITAQIAAETAFSLGVSESAFRAGYYKRIKRLIMRDNIFGKVLFKIYEAVYSSAFFTEVLMRVATDEKRRGRSDHLRAILWNMYTGNIPYSLILLKFLNPVLQWELVAATVLLSITKLFTWLRVHER